jgi:hypothetical protein
MFPLGMKKPPSNTKTTSAQVPPVLAITIVRHTPAINRNNALYMRCTKASNRNDLKNLQKNESKTLKSKLKAKATVKVKVEV